MINCRILILQVSDKYSKFLYVAKENVSVQSMTTRNYWGHKLELICFRLYPIPFTECASCAQSVKDVAHVQTGQIMRILSSFISQRMHNNVPIL